MAKKGYKPAMIRLPGVQKIMRDLRALHSLGDGVSMDIDNLPPFAITKTELERDFGFSAISLKLLRRFGLLTDQGRGRSLYDGRKALKILALLPGMANGTRIRTKRKHQNINSVMREYLDKITAN